MAGRLTLVPPMALPTIRVRLVQEEIPGGADRVHLVLLAKAMKEQGTAVKRQQKAAKGSGPVEGCPNQCNNVHEAPAKMMTVASCGSGDLIVVCSTIWINEHLEIVVVAHLAAKQGAQPATAHLQN